MVKYSTKSLRIVLWILFVVASISLICLLHWLISKYVKSIQHTKQLCNDSHPLPECPDPSALKKMIHGKDVVIVGPSKSLIGQRLGKHIDHPSNVVIRLNFHNRLAAPQRGDNITRDYGTRTDVLFHSFIKEPDNSDNISLVKSAHPGTTGKSINNTKHYRSSMCKYPNIAHEQLDIKHISKQLDKLKSFPTVGFSTPRRGVRL